MTRASESTPGKADAGGVGEAWSGRAVKDGVGQAAEEFSFKPGVKGGQIGGAIVIDPEGSLASGFAEGNDAWDVFGARAALTFVRATDVEGPQWDAFADVEGADALRCVHFVARDRDQVGAEFAEVDGQFADGLHGVGVEERPAAVGENADGLDRLEDARFVVGEHDGDEGGVGTESFADLVGGDEAFGSWGKVGDVDALLFELLSGVEDGVVLDGGGDEVLAGSEAAEEGVVVRLGAAGGEGDVGGADVEERGEVLAGVVDGGAGGATVFVHGAGVAEALGPERVHRVDDLAQDGRGGVVVEVDAAHAGWMSGGEFGISKLGL